MGKRKAKPVVRSRRISYPLAIDLLFVAALLILIGSCLFPFEFVTDSGDRAKLISCMTSSGVLMFCIGFMYGNKGI